MTVNGNPNWQMRLATSLSDLSTGCVIASSAKDYRTLTRSLSKIQESVQKKSETENEQTDKDGGDNGLQKQ